MEPDMQVQGYSALGHAASHPDLLQVLLTAGADANVGGGASTPLIEAAGGGNTAGVRLLLAAGADINGLAAGYSPLMAAVEQGEAALVQLLLEAGAEVNTRSATGHTPLGIALAAENRNLGGLARRGRGVASAGGGQYGGFDAAGAINGTGAGALCRAF